MNYMMNGGMPSGGGMAQMNSQTGFPPSQPNVPMGPQAAPQMGPQLGTPPMPLPMNPQQSGLGSFGGNAQGRQGFVQYMKGRSEQQAQMRQQPPSPQIQPQMAPPMPMSLPPVQMAGPQGRPPSGPMMGPRPMSPQQAMGPRPNAPVNMGIGASMPPRQFAIGGAVEASQMPMGQPSMSGPLSAGQRIAASGMSQMQNPNSFFTSQGDSPLDQYGNYLEGRYFNPAAENFVQRVKQMEQSQFGQLGQGGGQGTQAGLGSLGGLGPYGEGYGTGGGPQNYSLPPQAGQMSPPMPQQMPNYFRKGGYVDSRRMTR